TRPTLSTDLYEFLSEVRYGWWRPEDRLAQAVDDYKRYMTAIWRQETPIRGRDPEGLFTQYVEVPKQDEGTYLLLVESGNNRRAALMVVSSIAVVSKVSPTVTELWCTDLRTGQPLSGVEITVHRAQRKVRGAHTQRVYEPIRTGRTNADGLWRFETPTRSPADDWRGQLLTVKSPRSGQLVHWGRIDAAVWRDGAHTGEPLNGAIYTERPIYRPGHTIYFKGIARLGTAPNYRLPPPNTPVQISIINPRDEIVYETRTTLNRMGAFHASFTTSPEAETGYYRIRAAVGAYGTIDQFVPISAYRKPTYRITIKPEQRLYMPNETVRVQINTDYYFGMPVPNTQLMYTLYRREWWDGGYYDDESDSLSIDWSDEYDDYAGSVYGEVVATGELTTDAAGQARLTLRPADLLPQNRESRSFYWDESEISYEYTLEVYALSEGWEGAKAQARFEIAPSVWQAQLRPDIEFGEAQRAYRYTVYLTDRRTGQPVQATLRWRAGTLLAAGDRIRVEPQVEGVIQTDANGKAEFQFTPDVGSDWEVEISARDPEGNTFRKRHILWIWDDDYLPWWWGRTRNANALEARLNKRVFEPGESAELA
ncbi:MAG: MG2 domain-containing protein, partial [Fimbriimonadales bacterium]